MRIGCGAPQEMTESVARQPLQQLPHRSMHSLQLFVLAIAVVLSLAGFTYFFLASLFIMGCAAGVLIDPAHGARRWMTVCFCSILALISLTKIPESDLANYIYLIKEYVGLSLQQALVHDSISIKKTEVFYNLSTYIYSQLIGDHAAIYVFSVIFFTFFLASTISQHVYRYVAQWYGRSTGFAPIKISFAEAAALAAALMICITFSLAGHLLRQYAANAMFFMGLISYMRGKGNGALLLILLSCATHNSLVVPALLFVAAMVIARLPRYMALLLYFLGLVVAAVLSFKIEGLLGDVLKIALADQGDIPPVLIIGDLCLGVMVFLMVAPKGAMRNPEYYRLRSIIYLYLFFWMALLAVSKIEFIFFRFYFLNDFVRVVMLSALIGRFHKQIGPGLALTFMMVSLGYFIFKFDTSPWHYSNSMPNMMFDSFGEILRSISSNYG